MRFFKLDPYQVFVFYDIMMFHRENAEFGWVVGGHNGLRSIEKHIGPDYWRVRIGIGHPGRKELVLAHVLNDFGEQEKNGWVEKMLVAMTEHLNLLIKGTLIFDVKNASTMAHQTKSISFKD